MMLRQGYHRHARFLAALAFGGLSWAGSQALPVDRIMSGLIGVNAFFLCCLALIWAMILRTSPENMRRHAEQYDEGGPLILALALMAVAISLSSIFLVLNRATISPIESLFALSAAPLGWATLQVLAAFRYAHLYHAPDPDGGLSFPGTPKPEIWDFLYFSFVIGMTAQTADVAITTTRMRRVVLIHSVGSFFFNTVILAMAVNAAIALSQ
jgi:uncharacterized membrane protein